MYRLFLIVLFLWITPVLDAQITLSKSNYRDTVWLINGQKVLESPFRKRRLELSLDARRTLVGEQGAKLGGLRIGMEYRRVHRFGFGIYGLSEEVDVVQMQEIDPRITRAALNLGYLSVYYERILFFNPHWEWSATVHLGNGAIDGFYQLNNTDQWLAITPIRVKPLELSTSFYYNFNWWISLGVGGGYRYMRKAPNEAKDIYNSPVALFKVKIKLFKLVKGLFNPAIKDQY